MRPSIEFYWNMRYVPTAENITCRSPIRISFPKWNISSLYSNPPQNLYCFDECTCIQALKRLTPTLPPAADQPALEDFDYRRNGITDLLAFLNPATGQVYGQCTENHDRHTSVIGFFPPMSECIHRMLLSITSWTTSALITMTIFVGRWRNSAVYPIHLSKPGPNVDNGFNPRTNALLFISYLFMHPG